MRMKRSRIRDIPIYKRITTKNQEGSTHIAWEMVRRAKGEVWPAGGELQSQMYGQEVNSMYNIRLKGKYTIKNEKGHHIYDFGDFTITEGDAVCLFGEEQDFAITSIIPYNPIRLEVTRI